MSDWLTSMRLSEVCAILATVGLVTDKVILWLAARRKTRLLDADLSFVHMKKTLDVVLSWNGRQEGKIRKLEGELERRQEKLEAIASRQEECERKHADCEKKHDELERQMAELNIDVTKLKNGSHP